MSFLHHFFLPGESNNHRARLLHHGILVYIIGILLLASYFLPLISSSRPDVLGISSNISAQELLVLTNLKRQDAGLSPLVMNEQLGQAAQSKGQYMFAHDFWAHNAPDGTTPWFFVKQSGYEYTFAGENLARGFTTSGDVVNAWMDSPGHKANMLSPNYKEIGFAVLTGKLLGDETVLVVEMFGSRNTAPSEVSSVTDIEIPSPTPTIVAQIPTGTLITKPTATMTPTPVAQSVLSPTMQPHPTDYIFIASVKTEPLVNKEAFSRSVSAFLVFLFIAILAVDIVIIERRQIVRVVGHNLDHLLFLVVMLIIIFVIGQGAIL
jgi:uncharacterized protein YkwD